MLRQIHIFLESELLYVKNYAKALGNEELKNVKLIIQKYIDMPMPGKTFQRPVANFQIFHRAFENLYFLFITDIVDSLQYIDTIILKTIDKFKELFPNPLDINQSGPAKQNFNEYLDSLQKDLHSKIAIIGPAYSGKTTLYNMLRSGEEKPHMDFAKTSSFEIDGMSFDIWDFQLNDNFSLLWSKFVRGSDLLILFFNLANYNLKMINFFLNLHKNESNYSKLLIIGNKRDLVENADLKRIKNELSIPEFKEISLNAPDAKSEITGYISEILGLKEEFPENLENLVKEADDLVLEGKKIQALAKYKEILGVSESYQNIMFTKNLKQKVDNLNKKIKEDVEKRREFEKSKDFEVAKPLIFTRKVTVKPLPASESDVESQDRIITEEELPPAPRKTPQTLVSFQKLEKEMEAKPVKVSKPPLKVIKKIPPPKEIKKETTPTKTTDTTAPKAKMPMEIFGPHEDIKKDMEKPLVIDFTKELQNFISEQGSSLSLKLCENLISELQKSLERPLTIEDIKLAADFFVKQEKLS
ncbi:MAG: ADP-ribosylation factor-like protein [Candidatus Hermodarchaeota archaeon]